MISEDTKFDPKGGVFGSKMPLLSCYVGPPGSNLPGNPMPTCESPPPPPSPPAFPPCDAGASCARCLWAVPPEECPPSDELAKLPPCNEGASESYRLCQGDGECGTSNTLNNCMSEDGDTFYDVFQMGFTAPSAPPPDYVVPGNVINYSKATAKLRTIRPSAASHTQRAFPAPTSGRATIREFAKFRASASRISMGECSNPEVVSIVASTGWNTMRSKLLRR